MTTVKKTHVKEKAGNYQVSRNFYAALDEVLDEAIARAKERADANDRNTLMPHDV